MGLRAVSERYWTQLYAGKSTLSYLRWLVWLPAVVLLVPNLYGRANVTMWTLLSLLPPFLALVAVPVYRQLVGAAMGRCWVELEGYPVTAGPIPWLALSCCVVLPAGAFFLIGEHGVSSGDSRPAVLTACSLVQEGNWEIGEFVDSYVAQGLFLEHPGEPPYFFRQTEHGVYSFYPSGMVVFAMPATLLARASGADLSNPKVHHHIERWTAAWIAAACLGLFFLVGLHVATPAPVTGVTLLLGIGSVMFSTVAQALWQHGGVILGMLTILFVEFRSTSRPVRGGAVVQGIAAAMMVACRPSAALLLVPFGVWLLVRAPRRAAAMVLCAALAFLPWAWLYSSIYGRMFGPAMDLTAGQYWAPLGTNYWREVLFSPGRGILVYQPWLLLGLAAPLLWLRRTNVPERVACPGGWRLFCLAAILLHLALVTAWNCWWGGYCWGSRLCAEVIPLAALLCLQPIAALWSMRGGVALVAGVALLSFLMHIPGVYLRGGTWHAHTHGIRDPQVLWSWSDPPFLYPLRHRAASVAD
jgi:hypothetical protein